MSKNRKEKFLVTGGYGFIGSSLIRLILKNGDSVYNIDKLTYSSNIKSLEDYTNSDNYIFKQEDICNEEILLDIITKYKPDKIIHLAAETHVDRSIDNPSNFINTNIIGTYNLLTSSKKYWSSLEGNVKSNFKLLLVSTDEVYGSLDFDNNIFTEESSYKPNSPYSASKASSDLLGRAWFKTYKMPIIITNTSNNYGPWQFPEKLIPLTISKCLNKEKIPIYGNGQQIRDWIYVDDHSKGILSAIYDGKIGEKYNISSKNELKNITVVMDICNIFDRIQPMDNFKYKELIEFVEDRPGHDQRYALSNEKISKLGWSPSIDWLSGLEKTIQWYMNNKDTLKNYSSERLGRSI